MTDDRTSVSYWRSLERLMESPAVSGSIGSVEEIDANDVPGPDPRQIDEFPAGASHPPTGVSRRTMLGLMGASFGLAGLTACRRPVENIVPYVDAPEGRLPGVAERYATTLTLGTEAIGAVVESHEGRPTKVEGNTLHPASLGAASTWMQASVLDLYDPDRSRTVLHRAEPEGDHAPATWGDFDVFWSEVAADDAAPGGRGLAILSEGFASPTMARLVRRFAARYPQARFAVYEPAGDESLFAGIEQATGTARRPVLHLGRARTILALDADPLLTETGSLANARGFARRRKPDAEGGMCRLYAVESALSVTGANADHRIPVPSGRIAAVAAALARRLGVAADEIGLDLPSSSELPEDVASRLDLIVEDLQKAGAEALVTAGRRQGPAVHALVHRINQHLGAVGTTVTLHDLADVGWGRVADLAELTAAIRAGQVQTLVILGGNPAYDAPGSIGFAEALATVPHAVHLSDRLDETSRRCAWHLPRSHAFEAWGDARAADGTPSVSQPLIAPLFDSRSAIEVLAKLAGDDAWQGATQVQTTWGVAPQEGTAADPAAPGSPWRRLLHDGVLSDAVGLAGPPPGDPVRVLRPETVATTAGPDEPASRPQDGEGALELVFLVSPSVRDGRFANNAWLQEQPDPLTRITWDNVALVSPGTADEHGLETGDVVRIVPADAGSSSKNGAEGDGDAQAPALEIPAWVAPGQADGTVAVELGYGRSAAGRVGDGVGADVNRLRGLGAALFAGGFRLEATGGTAELAQTQEHWAMEGRDIVRETTPEGLREQAAHAARQEEESEVDDEADGALPNNGLSLWQEPDYSAGHQWGMVIDLARASAATPASPPARRRTTCRWSARSRSRTAGRCTGCGSTATSPARRRRRAWPSSRCPACTARTPRARRSARSARRSTTARA